MNAEISPGRSFVRQNPEERRPKSYRRVEKPNSEPPYDSEQNSNRQPIGCVVVLYDGTLSEKLDWDRDKLDGFAAAADLRSIVRVTSSTEQGGSSEYSSLGEVAIWKRFGNPLDLFRRRTKESKTSFVGINDKSGEVEICIKDQELSRELRDKNQGALNEIKYVNALAHEIGIGIQASLNWEKLQQVRESVKFLGIPALGIGVALSGLYIGIRLNFEGLSDMVFFVGRLSKEIIAPDNKDLLHGMTARIGLDLAKCLAGSATLRGSGIILRNMRSKTPDGKYIKSFRDFNTAKHIKDWIKGSFYLRTTGRQMVTLKENESSSLDR